ncbi:terminase small subunit protein [Bradyrhizobium sp. U87765 SZCCT0131]|uniref:terminase small subunit-like protein n=1 Tax=unclassified Bradyrhizobium TaxID=2631580 RepID=UPI001BADC771|nr:MULTISPECIES: terminase small subunit protein [unclassified Bradyrhizobium]MBR1219419.1 terminase small subunit protein [Bradyrhizobium sp. U87765 SZCCT0131]MBR1262070.1 terminase small subunit protein [Bradyrhizobium sp. U87765 SZCCT0134]MBR1306077.1 terminase small subunit protein [Bradyrhizobium sp. U87765 SZCCT0110]MBR1317852.1 terminase small subunit protein [Bradyrhizobium sp. U87765 SZCCT0109]MBR1351554.1 terminase small subunit protein [Bradyrhizobium sp. U87765 SZCCT0048]
MTGRPTLYTADVARRICAELCTGRTLRDVCRDAGMPTESTVRGWVQNDRSGFAARYRSAREVGYHAMADEILEIADDSRNDWIARRRANGEGEPMVDHEHVSRARLRVETRRWLLSKALPKIYGDRLDLKATHEAGDDLAALMKAIDGRTRGLP